MQTPRLDQLDSDQRARMDALADLLIRENRKTNLTAITDPAEVRLRHFEDSLAGLPVIREQAINSARDSFSIIDVGSGAGFPALVLAIALPECQITSLEATGKKTDFQKLAAQTLRLENLRVIQDRAETLGHDAVHRAQYDMAVARAVAALPSLLEIMLPFVREKGSALCWKGREAEKEMADAQNALDVLAKGAFETCPYELDEAGEMRLILARKNTPTPDKYPRKPKQIRKRPL
ncbi:MAG: 16S rRNA (guanine(527)-N(7))-methyltransferase RsmG [Candidatus Sumerlaeia bacterium]